MTTDPVFLTLDEVLALHEDQIHRYGGSLGVRDAGLLSSALGTVSASFGGKFLHESMFEMAAAYLYHIAQNHPFVDGNKRVALAAALIFLWMNDLEIDAEEDELTELVSSVSHKERSPKPTWLTFSRNTPESEIADHRVLQIGWHLCLGSRFSGFRGGGSVGIGIEQHSDEGLTLGNWLSSHAQHGTA